MYLKKLELCGFKSFADKTVLTFEKGVSAIIGPNGCGKSNISDSIRWCLGEKKTKTIRTKAMQDVIFGGTKARAAAGMCEVTLTFDNSQNVIPINYSEVSITRKLFRSGESEYFINKTQCRLKDIIDMFLDTGIGTGGYSSIEQGKIDELVMANPEKRREFFEEAAGVSKYKLRREETLTRLKNIEVDLSRLDDSLKIFEGQIKQLDQQAKKAKQCKKYKEDLEKYEVAEVVNNLARGYEELEKIKAKIEPKLREYETVNVLLHQLEAQQQDLRLSQTENNEKYVSLNAEFGELKTNLALADQEIVNLRQKDADLIQEQDRLKIEIEDCQSKIQKYEQDLHNVNTADDGIENEVATLKQETQARLEKYNLIKQQVIDLETQEDEFRTKLDDFAQTKNSLINSKTSIIQEQAQASAEILSMDRNIERLTSNVAPANKEIADNERKLQEVQNSLKELNDKIEINKQVILNTDTEIENLKDEEIKLNKKISGLEAKISTMKEMDAKSPIKKAINSIKSLGYIKYTVGEIISPDFDKIDLVANALGDKIDYLICDTIQQAEDAIKYLLDNNLCKLTFLVSEKIADDIKIISSTDSAIELFKILNCLPNYEKICKFISYGVFVNDGKIYSDVLVSGGAKNVSDKPVLVEEQIKKLLQEIELTKQELENISKEINAKDDVKLNISFEKQDNDRLNIQLTSKIEFLQETIKQRKLDISDANTEIENLQKEKNKKQQLLDSVNEKVSDIEQKLMEVETETVTLTETLNTIEQQIDALRNQEEQANQEYIEVSNNYQRRNSDLEHRATGQKYIKDNINNLKAKIEQDTNRVAQIETDIQGILLKQETQTTNIQQYNEAITQKETELQLIISDRDKIQTNIDAKEVLIADTRTKVAQLNDEVNVLQSDQKSYITQKDMLEEQILKTYGKTYEEIKEQYIDIEVNKEEIVKLKKKIESFGAINWSAEEEYESLSQRYTFIQNQQKDLLKAKSDLEETIKKINETTVVNFKKTFDEVREHFKNLYKKLFGGGDADLILTDENNLLETGVDIKAQPPGKLVKNIMQCSGGEKALTAVALTFSFFLAKPSPFCILDEVEAPLDDANIGRYINVISEFSKDTQFLVVTHNKRTMEMADTLYGITMEKQGISNIIAIKFTKDSEKEIDQILSKK